MKRILFLFTFFCFSQSIYAHPSWGIVVGSDGNIYFTDVMHHTDGGLCRIDMHTYEMTVIQDDMHAHDLFADKEGYLWAGIDIWRTGSIEGEGHHYLVRYNIADERLDTLLFTDDEDVFFGNSIAIDNDKSLAYFTIHKKIWSNDMQDHVQQVIPHEFGRINTFTLDEEGSLWITDKTREGGTLYKWNEQDGLMKWATKLLPVNPADPIFEEERHQIFYAIGFDGDGMPLLCDNTSRTLRRITPTESSVVYSSEKNWHPIGVSYDDGEYYVMESGWERTHMGPRITVLDSTFNKLQQLDIDADAQTVMVTDFTEDKKDAAVKGKKGSFPVYLLPLFIAGVLLGMFRKRIFSKKSNDT